MSRFVTNANTLTFIILLIPFYMNVNNNGANLIALNVPEQSENKKD